MQNILNLAFLFLLTFGADMALADTPPAANPPAETPPAPTAQEIQAIRDENKRLKDENDDYKKKATLPPTPPEDEDLITKAKKQSQSTDETAKEIKAIEKALQFNLGVDDFVKNNQDLLPSEIINIVSMAHKETYDSAAGKASALKASMIQSYFLVEANREALTKNQLEGLDDYLKLTKTGKEDKASEIFTNIFEPALETTRKIKKAEELGRSNLGFSSGNDAENAYRDRLIKGSRRAHLNEKEA